MGVFDVTVLAMPPFIGYDSAIVTAILYSDLGFCISTEWSIKQKKLKWHNKNNNKAKFRVIVCFLVMRKIEEQYDNLQFKFGEDPTMNKRQSNCQSLDLLLYY